MKIIPISIAVLALPLMALGQTQDQQQGGAQGQTNEHQEKTPAKKRTQPSREPLKAKPDTGANMHHPVKAETHNTGAKKSEANSSTTTKTKVNKQEFKSSHHEVYTLGRHPKEFFVQRYGDTHFRLIGSTYFVFVDGCWVSVDVIGFTFIERTICEGDPDYIVVY